MSMYKEGRCPNAVCSLKIQHSSVVRVEDNLVDNLRYIDGNPTDID